MRNMPKNSILVVEDDPITCFVVSELSSIAEVDVDIVETASACINRVREHPEFHQVILMDINLPDFKGDEATRIIRSMPEDPPAGVTIFAHSSDNDWANESMLELNGFDGFIPKPITVDALQELRANFST